MPPLCLAHKTSNQAPDAMSLEDTLLLAACLLCVGLYGLLTSANLVRALMCLELLFNAVNLNLVAYSHFLDGGSSKGQVFALFVIAIAAAEATIGLAIVLALYRAKGSVLTQGASLLRW